MNNVEIIKNTLEYLEDKYKGNEACPPLAMLAGSVRDLMNGGVGNNIGGSVEEAMASHALLYLAANHEARRRLAGQDISGLHLDEIQEYVEETFPEALLNARKILQGNNAARQTSRTKHAIANSLASCPG